MPIEYVEPLQNLIQAFRRLPGVGTKSATRMAFAVLSYDQNKTDDFIECIKEAKRSIKKCKICGNFAVGDTCDVCMDSNRNRDIICVVEDAKAIMAFENTREYRGLYHVLGGVLSPMKGVGVENLHINELVERVEKNAVTEVIIATNPTVEGETTALYISKLLAGTNVKVTRLAYGIPVGGDLEYADSVTLNRAIQGRHVL